MAKGTRVYWSCDMCGAGIYSADASVAENVVVDGVYAHPEPGYNADLCATCMVKVLREWATRLDQSEVSRG